MKRSKPNPKRTTPRRGRVVDKDYLEWASKQPCCIMGTTPATTHHVRFCGSPKDDDRIIRLIPQLHFAWGERNSIENVGKENFERLFNISIEDEISKLRKRYEREVLGVTTDSSVS